MALAVLKRMLALVGFERFGVREGAGQQLDELGAGELALRLVGRGGHAVDDAAVDEVVDVVVIPRVLGDVRELRDVDAAHQRHRVADRLGGGLDADVVGRRARSGNLQLGQGKDTAGNILNNELSFRKVDLVIHVNGGLHFLRRLTVDLILHRIAGQTAHANLNGTERLREAHNNGLIRLEINLILRANVDKVFINRNICSDRAIRFNNCCASNDILVIEYSIKDFIYTNLVHIVGQFEDAIVNICLR